MKPVVAHVLSRKINFMRRPGSELLSSTGFNPDNVSCKDNRQTFTNISTGIRDFFLRQTKQTRKQANKQKSTNQIEGCWIFPYAAQSAQLVVDLKQGAALLPLTVFIPGLFFLPPNFSCDCHSFITVQSPTFSSISFEKDLLCCTLHKSICKTAISFLSITGNSNEKSTGFNCWEKEGNFHSC